MDSVLVRYHEIALKKGNRRYFIELLKRNLIASLADLRVKEVRNLPARLLITFRTDFDPQAVVSRLSAVFGVANFSLVQRTDRDMDFLLSEILQSMEGKRFSSFRIETQRGDKTFPLTSPEINRRLGAGVKARSGARVD